MNGRTQKKEEKLFLPDQTPTVHVGTSNLILPALGAEEDEGRGREPNQKRPNPFQNRRSRDPQEWGLQAQKKHTRRQEVADGKPFRY